MCTATACLEQTDYMYVHYLFDYEQLSRFQGAFMKWWKENYAYPGSSVYKVKVRLVGDTGKTLEKFLIQKLRLTFYLFMFHYFLFARIKL